MRPEIGWALLVAAGLLEIVWAAALRAAQGFTLFWPSAIGIAGAVMSFVLLALALRHLPLGPAYAVWVGIGAGGVALYGIVALGEAPSLARLGCIGLILAGVAGLKLAEG